MAGRSQFYQSIGYRDTLADNAYRVVLTGRVTVYVAPPFAAQSMTTLAEIFSAATGVGSPGNPFDATAGEANFYVGPGAYDVKIEDMAVPARFATLVMRFESQPGDQGILAQMIPAGTIGTSAIADGAINDNKIASNAAISESKLALTPGQLWMPGDVKQTTRTEAPLGWIKAIGLTLSRSTYPALWTVAQAEISAGNAIYGAGNGTTTFSVADLSRRVLIGAGAAVGLSTRALGSSGGAERADLTLAQTPAHSHTVNGHAHTVAAHSHAVDAHQHTVAAHSHAVDAHAHLVDSHAHLVNGHSHTVNGHTHNVATHNHGGGDHLHPMMVSAGSVGNNRAAGADQNVSQMLIQGNQNSTGVQNSGPIITSQAPATDLQSPGTDLQSPATDLRSPGTDLRSPGTTLQSPTTDFRTPITDLRSPATDLQSPLTNAQSPVTDLQSPGTNSQGSSQSHDNMQPFVTVHTLIKT